MNNISVLLFTIIASSLASAEDVYFVGFRSSAIVSPQELAALVPVIGFDSVSSKGCNVKTTHIRFSTETPTEVAFSEPVHLFAEVIFTTTPRVLYFSCAPGIVCPPPEKRCTTQAEAKASIEEMIEKRWKPHAGLEVKYYRRGIVPNPGVTVSN